MPLYGSADLSMAQAPSGSRGTSPTEGQLYYDTDEDTLYAYSGTTWKSVTVGTATGGTITTYSGNKVHTFTSNGTFTVSGGSLTCDILMVGAGGGGGGHAGGGGGAGGVLYIQGKSVSSGDYTMTIGAGGSGGVNQSSGSHGASTTAFSETATAGGGGGNPAIAAS